MITLVLLLVGGVPALCSAARLLATHERVYARFSGKRGGRSSTPPQKQNE